MLIPDIVLNQKNAIANIMLKRKIKIAMLSSEFFYCNNCNKRKIIFYRCENKYLCANCYLLILKTLLENGCTQCGHSLIEHAKTNNVSIEELERLPYDFILRSFEILFTNPDGKIGEQCHALIGENYRSAPHRCPCKSCKFVIINKEKEKTSYDDLELCQKCGVKIFKKTGERIVNKKLLCRNCYQDLIKYTK